MQPCFKSAACVLRPKLAHLNIVDTTIDLIFECAQFFDQTLKVVIPDIYL